MTKAVREDRQQLAFRLTQEQFDALGGGAIKKLTRLLQIHDDLPKGNFTAKDLDSKATRYVGGHIHIALYTKLQTLAKTNGLSMTKTAIRLLQLPE